ncbi:MAG TPA: pirin family protein [Polyangiaceae bacterium]
MTSGVVLSVSKLGFPWQTADPFLFCVHHDDGYPAGNAAMGPATSLAGRNIGQDFAGKDGWRMYHGDVVPGFPQHPHRGFETVTIVRQGLIDHSDSLGAVARFGGGDTQWLTAGRGIVHSEMFPLIEQSRSNPLELFQIWLNLPGADKMVEPHFTMLWNDSIPRRTFVDGAGAKTTVAVVAGTLGDAKGPPPPPKSWAARPDTDVAIWTIELEPRATFTLPAAASAETNRVLYYFKGAGLTVAGDKVPSYVAIALRGDAPVELVNADSDGELLLLQGKPINEPVVQHGPFVMNTQAEIQTAFLDYRRTGFGGWPWPSDGPVHPREQGRFARHADGRVESLNPAECAR